MEDNLLEPVTGEPGRYVTEASMMNWAPGLWPVSFVFNGETYTYSSELVKDGDVLYKRYVSRDGTKLITVFND